MALRVLVSEDDPLYWPALEFYVDSFPLDEREPLGVVAGVASGRSLPGDRARGQIRRFMAEERDGLLAAISYFATDAEARLLHFVYLAVVPGFRRHGLGGSMIRGSLEQGARDLAELGSGLDAAFFECEHPGHSADSADEAVRNARIEFFLRQGARVLSTEYVQPSLGDGRKPIPMVLLGMPAHSEPDWPEAIRDYHRRFLGHRPGSDEEARVVADHLSRHA